MRQPSVISRSLVPVVHYGMLDIDVGRGYASGGFSRVYIGTYKEKKIALKLLFAVELTPQSIVEFYQEAQVLNDLKHDQIVTCLGITIIPPAIGVLMEYCPNGSLFDFLYKSSSKHNQSFADQRGSESSALGLRMSIFKPRLSQRQSEGSARQSETKSHRMTESDDSDIQFEMLLDAARGVAYMHSRGYMHCDIKSPNFLVTEVRKICCIRVRC
jgi:serine/threonine protein kinase